MEKEARSPPQAQEKKDEGEIVSSWSRGWLSAELALTASAANKRLALLDLNQSPASRWVARRTEHCDHINGRIEARRRLTPPTPSNPRVSATRGFNGVSSRRQALRQADGLQGAGWRGDIMSHGYDWLLVKQG